MTVRYELLMYRGVPGDCGLAPVAMAGEGDDLRQAAETLLMQSYEGQPPGESRPDHAVLRRAEDAAVVWRFRIVADRVAVAAPGVAPVGGPARPVRAYVRLVHSAEVVRAWPGAVDVPRRWQG